MQGLFFGSMSKNTFATYFAIIQVLLLSLLIPGGVQANNDQSFSVFPTGVAYQPYLAAPLEPRFKLSQITASDQGLPRSSQTRWELKAGRTIGLLRINRQWQVNVFGGFMAIFDVEKSTDSIAWDGLYGLQFVREFSDRTAVKFEVSHQSAHRGDEFIERTALNRIGYTRQELNLGLSHSYTNTLRTYVEGGWATSLNNPRLQEEGRLQWGLEYGIPSRKSVKNQQFRWGWFSAVDLESMQERDWQIDYSLNAGLYVLKFPRLWRVGLEVRKGRSPYGEFFNRDETYWGISFWNDFL
jgi:hypothetical protein